MPQFDVSTYASQIFWLFVCFFIIYTYTSRVTLGKISAILEARWNETEGKKNHAQDLTHEAHQLKAQNEEKVKASKTKAHRRLDTAFKETAILTEHRKHEIFSMMLKQYHQAEARIHKRRNEVLLGAEPEARLLSSSIVKRLRLESTPANARSSVAKDTLS
jgi:F-type H+-transporting ATPase subunit b